MTGLYFFRKLVQKMGRKNRSIRAKEVSKMKASYEKASRSRADLRNRAQQGYHQAMSEYMKKKIECREKGMSKEEEP